MYKKAGIVIAVILVVAGVLAISVSSCTGHGGLQVNNINEQSGDNNSGSANVISKESGVSSESQANTQESPIIAQESTEVQLEVSQSQVSSQQSSYSSVSKLTTADESMLQELSSYIDEKSNEIVITDEQESKYNEPESQVSEPEVEQSSNSEYMSEFVEINKDSIKYESVDKEIFGTVKGTKMFYSNNSLYTSVTILGQDGSTYNYFVPYSTYESLKVGTKLKLKVRYYFSDGVSLNQVLGVELAE